MNPGEPLRIALDSALEPGGEQIELPSQSPFGHYVAHKAGFDFVIVSECAGELGSFSEAAMAQPFLRMLAREAYLYQRRFDFRLYHWIDEAWEIAQRSIELHEIPTPGPHTHAMRDTRERLLRQEHERIRRRRECARGCYLQEAD
jgi:hypothetical protein